MEKRENRDAQRGNTVLLTIIGVATLLVALVGATFAYFSATVSNTNNESVTVTTQTPVALIYTGAALSLTDALPGRSATNTFTVQNPNTSPSDQTYDLTFYIDSNNFATSTGDKLTLKITGTSSGSNTPSITGDFASAAEKDYTDGTTYDSSYSNKFIEDQRIAPNETHTYTAVIDFKDLSVENNTNVTKSFTGHVDISDAKNANAQQSS